MYILYQLLLFDYDEIIFLQYYIIYRYRYSLPGILICYSHNKIYHLIIKLINPIEQSWDALVMLQVA